MKKTPNYECNACGALQYRASYKLWMKSYCSKTGKNARLYRINNRSK